MVHEPLLFFRHTFTIWDTKTRQAYSAEEAELENLLDDNNELNCTDNHSMDEKKVEVHIQPVADLETFPTIYKDTDWVSTFNPVTLPDKSMASQPSSIFHPKSLGHATSQDGDSVSKISDADSRLTSLEYNFNKFQDGMKGLSQAKKEAQHNAKMFADILEILHTNRQGGKYLATQERHVLSDSLANHPDQMTLASGSIGTAGYG
jgi:hypothetical protein